MRWSIAGRMGLAWLITLPCAGLVGAAMWWIGTSLGPWLGPIAIFMILVVLSLWMWLHSRIKPIGHHNVNDEWDGDPDHAKDEVTVAGGVHR